MLVTLRQKGIYRLLGSRRVRCPDKVEVVDDVVVRGRGASRRHRLELWHALHHVLEGLLSAGRLLLEGQFLLQLALKEFILANMGCTLWQLTF